MTIEQLKTLMGNGKFHHATYRDLGKIWEGLYIYVKHENRFNGFNLEGCFGKDDPALEQAFEIVKNTGWSLGSYGNG